MTIAALFEQAVFWSYRLCTHAALNWLDDPALLAIVFC
jgi:hypothetical protein